MPMLKTITSGSGGCRQLAEYLVAGERGGPDWGESLQRYLAGDVSASRARAFGHSDDLPDNQVEWAEAMRAARARWGKDEPPEWFRERMRADPSLSWRNYYHWTISPDPRDRAGAEEVGELAREWCERCWPQDEGYQWVWSVHDDNGARIMHAHIVLNAVNAATGRKVQIGRARSDELAEEAQVLAEMRGMGRLPSLSEARRRAAEGDGPASRVSRRVSAAEAAMRRRGARSWVGEIRDAIDRAVGESSTWEGFVSALEGEGFRVERSRRGLGFRHPESTGSDKKVLSGRLGEDYSEEGIRIRLAGSFDDHLIRGAKRADTIRRGPIPLPKAPDAPLSTSRWIEIQLGLGLRRRVEAIEEMVEAIGVLRDEEVSGLPGIREAVATAASILAEAESEVRSAELGARAASEVLERATDAEEARRELELIPDGTLGREERLHRNGLLERIADDESFCAASLKRGEEWIAGKGLWDASDAEKAEALLREYRRRAEDAKVRSTAARQRVRSLSRAEDAAMIVMGRRATARRELSPRRAVPVAPPRRAAQQPDALSRASAEAAARSLARLIDGLKAGKAVEGHRTHRGEQPHHRVAVAAAAYARPRVRARSA